MNCLGKIIKPISLTSSQFRLNNTLLSAGQVLERVGNNSSLTLKAGSDSSSDIFCWVRFDCALGTIIIGLGQFSLRSIISRVDSSEDPSTLKEASLLLVLVEAASDTWVSRLEKSIDAKISLHSISFEMPDQLKYEVRLSFQVYRSGLKVENMLLLGDEAVTASLCNAIEEILPADTDHDVGKIPAIPVLASLGSTEVLHRDLRGLEAGDVIFITRQTRSNPDELTLKIGARHTVVGTYHKDGICVIFDEENNLMVENKSNSDNSEPVGNMAVRLDFDIGSVEIDIKDLQNVTEGYVFAMDRNAKAPVVIRCGTRIVGSGELVEINGKQLAVRLVTMSSTGSQDE